MAPIVSEEYKEKKKREILESALQAFGEKGFQVATIDDIVAHSGMSKGAIYNYFTSKEDIYLQLMNMRTEQNFNEFEKHIHSYKTASEKLTFLFRAYADTELNESWQRSIQVHIEFFINSARHEELKKVMMERFNRVYLRFVKEIIEEGKKNGEFGENVDPTIIASLFWGIIDGVCLHYSVLDNDYSYREIIKKAEEIILPYISK